MHSKVYFIKTIVNDEKYYSKLIDIIEKSSFYDNIDYSEKVS